jgi:hypothetical protein
LDTEREDVKLALCLHNGRRHITQYWNAPSKVGKYFVTMGGMKYEIHTPANKRGTFRNGDTLFKMREEV